MDEEIDRSLPAAPWFESLRRRLRVFSDDLVIIALVLVGLLIFLLPSMIVTIPAGHVGVQWKRFAGGTVLDRVLPEGTAVIPPWDRVFIYDARIQTVERQLEVLSSDGLKLKVDVAWRFRVNRSAVARLHQFAGPDYAETLLAPTVTARARDVFAVYQPEEIYTAHRLEIQEQITESVRYDLRNRFNPAPGQEVDWTVFEDVVVRGITLPPGVEESIVRKNMARHEVEQYALIVQREQKETERKRIEATGIRNFQEIVSGGMNEAYLRWRGIEATLELARSENAKVVVIGNAGSGGLPLIINTGEAAANGNGAVSLGGAGSGASGTGVAGLAPARPAGGSKAPLAPAPKALAASAPTPAALTAEVSQPPARAASAQAAR